MCALYSGLLLNARLQREDNEELVFEEHVNEAVQILIHTDHTFNQIKEDWCIGSISVLNNRRVRSVMTGESMPIVYVLTRTETGAAAANMFTSARDFLRTF